MSNRMKHTVSDIANVNVVPFEILLEKDEVSVCDGGINEMVHEQIDSHPRREAEYRSQAKRDDIRGIEKMSFRLCLGSPIERDGCEWRFFRTERKTRRGTVPAIRVGKDDELAWAA